MSTGPQGPFLSYVGPGTSRDKVEVENRIRNLPGEVGSLGEVEVYLKPLLLSDHFVRTSTLLLSGSTLWFVEETRSVTVMTNCT